MGHGIGGIAIAQLVGLLPLLSEAIPPETPPRLVVTERRVSARGSDWKITYRLRYTGDLPLQVREKDVFFEYEAVLSNARCPSHGFPKPVSLTLEGSNPLSGSVELIGGNHAAGRCREIVSVQVDTEWDERPAPQERLPVLQVAAGRANSNHLAKPQIELRPGMSLSMTVDLKHEHRVCRNRDPLLGTRRLRLRLGSATLEDEVKLDRVHEFTNLQMPVLKPDNSRCDHEYYHSRPASLHLHEGRPRDRSYRFASIPVCHGSTISISFWYCVAPGSEAVCRVRAAEYHDHANGWTRLGDSFDEALPALGKWARFERQLTIRADTTTLSIDFRFEDGQPGEAWIDDLEVSPLAPVDAER